MEYVLFTETMKELKRMGGKHDAALVAFSGGKDSLVCLDMACKTFKRVVPFFQFLVPGLRCIDEKMTIVKEKYGLDVLYYPHFLLFKALRNRVYCSSSLKTADRVKEYSLTDVYKTIIHDTGIQLVINGSKESDSLWRRQKYFKFMTFQNVYYPLKKWRKGDILAYLKMNNIPLPSSSGHQSTGVDLSTPSLLWLHDNYPDDFERMERHFPFIGAVVKRREYYGIK